METTTAPATHVLVTEARYKDRKTVVTTVRPAGGRPYGLSFTATGQQYRQIQDGPMLDGPHLSGFKLPTVIAAYPLDKDPEITINEGDIVEVDGERFTFKMVHDRWSGPRPVFTSVTSKATHTYTTSTGQRFGWIESQRFDHAHGNKHSGPTSYGRIIYSDGTESRPREVSVSALSER